MKQKWIIGALILALGVSLGWGWSQRSQKEEAQAALHGAELDRVNTGFVAASRMLVHQEDLYWQIGHLLPDGEEDPEALAELKGYLVGAAGMDCWLTYDSAVKGLAEEDRALMEKWPGRFYEHDQFLADHITDCPAEHREAVREQSQLLMALLRDEVMTHVFGGELTNSADAFSKLEREMEKLEKLLEK